MPTILEVSNLSKNYHRGKEVIAAVKDVSFSLREQEIVGLLGPNGAGKTSTVKMISGLLCPDAGQIRVDGVNPWKQRSRALSKISAVLEGNRNMYYPLTVAENLEFFAGLHGIARKESSVHAVHIAEQLHLEDKYHTQAQNLSRGMQQKLALGIALIKNVPLIILDEPTLGLDVETTLDMRRMLKSLAKDMGKTILITTHDMHLVEAVCSRVVIMNRGTLVADTSVLALMDLFRTKAYTFTMSGVLSEPQKNLLQDRPLLSISRGENGNDILRAHVEDARTFYDLMDIFKKEQCEIESIQTDDIDFESVFLQMMKEGKK